MRRVLRFLTLILMLSTLSVSASATEEIPETPPSEVGGSEDVPTEAPPIDPSTCEHSYTNWEAAGDVHSHICTKCGKTESEGHNWNSGVFLVEPTCCTDGEVRYSCINCIYDKVEVAPATGVHSYKDAQPVDGETHKLTCPGCQDVKIEAHTWNGGFQKPPATCASEGEMEYRCTQCATYKHETIPKTTEHAYGDWDGDEFTHTRSCVNCGNVESGAHSWYGGTVLVAPTCKEVGVMGYLCGGCDMVLLEEIPMRTAHVYDNDCDADCNSCGELRDAGHQYSTVYSKNATGHWYACSVCGSKKDFASHIPGPAATENSAQTCTACGYVLQSRKNHTHQYQKTWSTDEDGHWYACTGCEVQKDFGEHVYDDACDADCNVCGYITSTAHTYDDTWQTDERGHWRICTACNQEGTHEPHIPGPEATETDPQICTTCSFLLAPVQKHVHSGGETWRNDSEKHWKLCECGEILEEAAHVWGEGAQNADATVTYTCAVCGLTKTEGGPTEAGIPAQTQNGSSMILVIFAAILLALIGAVTALVLVLKPKKRGRFTK